MLVYLCPSFEPHGFMNMFTNIAIINVYMIHTIYKSTHYIFYFAIQNKLIEGAFYQ